jgi:hypothetical protein
MATTLLHIPRFYRKQSDVAVFLVWMTATLLFMPFCAMDKAHKLSAQTPQKNEKTGEKAKVEQPLELPEFVITGVESLDVPGGSKQTPKLPPKLNTNELQRFNPLDKLSFSLLPQAAMPRLNLPMQERNGFLKGEFGMFITPSIDAGYRAVLGNFDLTANAGATFSNGHLRNADFSDIYGQISSSYLAPEKFLFFGGSRTDSYIRARHRSYKFFAMADTSRPTLERTALTISGGVQTVGAFEDWVYDMGVSTDFLGLQTSEFSGRLERENLTNYIFKGHILAKKIIDEWAFGGTINAQTQGFAGAPTFDFLLTPSIVVEFRNTQKTTELLFQGGANITSLASQTILPTATVNAALHLGSGLSLYADAFSGMRMNTPFEIFAVNPYFSVLELQFPIINPSSFGFFWNHTLYDAKLSLRFQPSTHFAFTLGGRSEAHQGAISFLATNRNGEVDIARDTTSIHRVFAEGAFMPDSSNTLTARINANASLSVKFGSVPFLAPLEASLEYRRYWIPTLSTTLTGVYIAERNHGAIFSTLRILPAFVDIRLHAEYHISPQFSVYARATNLLNQPIFIWDGYQERGIFAALGVMFVF